MSDSTKDVIYLLNEIVGAVLMNGHSIPSKGNKEWIKAHTPNVWTWIEDQEIKAELEKKALQESGLSKLTAEEIKALGIQ